MSSPKQPVPAVLIRWASDRMKRLSQALDWLTTVLKRIHDTARALTDLVKRLSQELDRLATWLEPRAG